MSRMPFSRVQGVAERRASTRFRCGARAACRPFSENAEDIDWSVRILDISCGGVRLLVERRFESGTILKIDTAGVSSNAPNVLVARVVHVGRQNDGGWSLGCQFARELPSRELFGFFPQSA